MEDYEFELESLPETTVAPHHAASATAQQPSGILRNVARTGARVAESLAGLPGDVLSGTFGVGNYLTGGRIPTYESVQEKAGSFPTLPTSSQLRETVTKGFTGEALEPQTEGEALYDTIVSDIATLGAPVKGKIPFKSAIIKSLSGNAASWLTKEVGGSEGAQTGAKLGTMVLAGLAGGRRTLAKRMANSYGRAETLIKEATGQADNLARETKPILDTVSKGVLTPSKALVKEHVEAIQKSINNGKIGLTDALELKRDINEVLYRTAHVPKRARPLLRQMSGNLNKVLADYGKINPEFAKYFYEAEDIYKGLNKGSIVNKFLQKHVNIEGSLKNPLSKIILLGSGYKLGGIPGAIGSMASAASTREAVKGLEFIFNSSTARKYYADIVKSSLARDVAAAKKAAINLNKAADNYQKKNEPEADYEFELESL
jgi:hypothetical protein